MNIVSGVIEVLLFYYLKISMDIITLVMLVVVIELSFFFFIHITFIIIIIHIIIAQTQAGMAKSPAFTIVAMEDSALAPVI